MADKKTKNQNTENKIAIEDADLWSKISGSVRPINEKSKNKIRHSDLPGIEEKEQPASISPKPKPQAPVKKSSSRPTTHQARGPQLTGIDRRSKQKLLRGNVDIDARIDLHGATQVEARARLFNFLVSSQQKGAEFVLVITGKGASPFTRHMLHGEKDYSAPEREGILRQSLPDWMQEKDFSDLVSGFQPAHPRHGGGGAFYVKIRRRK